MELVWIGGIVILTLATLIAALWTIRSPKYRKWVLENTLFAITFSAGSIIWLFYLLFLQASKVETKSVEQQIQHLDGVRQSLQDLTNFVDTQKRHILEVQETLKSLKKEHAQLEPIISAERNTVEATLAVFEQRSTRQKWVDRLSGFLLGLLSSVLATVLMRLFDAARSARPSQQAGV